MSRSVVLVSTGLGRGGAETQLVRLADGLAARGWQTHLVSLIDRNGFAEHFAKTGRSFEIFPYKQGDRSPRVFLDLARTVRARRPDVLCAFTDGANLASAAVGSALRVPAIVMSIRNRNPPGSRMFKVYRAAAALVDHVVFNTTVTHRDALIEGVADGARCRTIRNGIRVEDYQSGADRTAVRASLGIAPSDHLWLAVGNVRREKNYPALVEAFGQLAARYPSAKLRIAGKAYEDDPVIRGMYPELWASGTIAGLGSRTDVPDLQLAADSFVLSSRTEALPNTVMEAMAARKPVVATDVGGVRDLIVDGQTGFLAPASEPGPLLDAMDRMMRLTPDELARLGANAEAHVRRHFGQERMVDEWESIFLQTLAAKGR